MDKKYIVSFCLSFILWGCVHKPENFYQRAIDYVMPLVDSGYMVDDYINLYELATNDSNSIYEISCMLGPFSRPEYPSKIVKQNGKFFCFTELDEPELSVEQIYILTNRQDKSLDCSSLDLWFLGISKYGENGVVIRDSAMRIKLIEYSCLWPYLSLTKPNDKSFFMCLTSHDLEVSNVDSIVDDSLKFFINRISGEIEIFNRTDSTIVLSLSNRNKSFVVINGSDTLDFVISESFPLEIHSNDSETLRYLSSENKTFFQKLPSSSTWDDLYKMLSDSTFSLLKINGKDSIFHLMHNDFRICSELKSDSGKVLKELWNKGVFDKQKRSQRFFKFVNN